MVGTLTGTPPVTTGTSGVRTSATASDSVNSVTVAWRWLPTLPELTGSLVLSPTSINLGQEVTATLTVENVGYAPAGTFKTIVPIANAVTAPTLVSQSTGTTGMVGTSEIDCTTTSLAAAAVAQVVVTYEPSTGPSLTLTGTIDASDQVQQITRAGDSLTSNTVTIAGLPELTGTLVLSPTSMSLGQYVTATLTIENVGSGPASSFETVVPIVNPYTPETLVSLSTGTSCIPYDSELDCTTTSLAAAAMAQVVISYEPSTGPSLTLTGTIDAYDQVPQTTRAGDSLTSNTVTIAGTGADLSVVAANVASTPQGSNLLRTLTVTNSGDTPAYNVVVQDWSGWFPLVPTGVPRPASPSIGPLARAQRSWPAPAAHWGGRPGTPRRASRSPSRSRLLERPPPTPTPSRSQRPHRRAPAPVAPPRWWSPSRLAPSVPPSLCLRPPRPVTP